MSALLLGIVPLILIFFVGVLLRITKVFNKNHADDFIKIVFYVSLPGLVLNSILKTELTIEFAYLPLISAILIFAMYGLGLFIGRLYKLPKKSLGVFIIGIMILNNGFMLPFIIGAYGEEGLSRLIIFDFSNGLLAFTFAYYQAIKYGNDGSSKKIPYQKFLYSPPIWALLIAIGLNLTKQELPVFVMDFFKLLGDLTIPLLMLSIGIFFTPKTVRFFPMITAIFLRSGIGLAIGFLLCWLFGLEGLSRTIVLVSSSAPIGFNTITFASLENLDKEFAASLVSIAIIVGLILTPILIYVLG
jgi:malate permease and related proteins